MKERWCSNLVHVIEIQVAIDDESDEAAKENASPQNSILMHKVQRRH